MNKNDTVAVIRSLLSSTNSSYSIFKLTVDFKNETGIDIPLFGHANITDFLHSIPDTVKISGIHPVQQVSLVTNNKSGHIVSLVKRQKNGDQKKGPKLFPRKTAAAYRTRRFQKPQTGVTKNTPLSFREETFSFSENERYSPGTNFVLQSTDSKLNVNDRYVSLKNCLSPGQSIPHISIELHAQVGRYVEVHLCHIFSPHKFYFHLRKLRKKLSNFTDKLQTFYNTHNVPDIGDDVIKPKLICAAFCKVYKEPMWYRAEINEVVNVSQVMVNLIDYGVIVKISKKNLKYLHEDFTSLPRQAILGSLANVKPSRGDSDWSPGAISRFSELSLRKDLLAGVVHIDTKANCMKVALSSTKGLEIHINDTLVKEGFAEFDLSITYSVRETSNANNSNKNGFFSKKIVNYEEEFSEDILKSLKVSTPQKLPTPVFYLSNTYGNNNRLKKMFSCVN